MNQRQVSGKRYVLVTAAYNEEHFLGSTIDAVVSQSTKPDKWIVVSDGSTDATDEMVLAAARAHPFIQLLRIDEEHPRDFAAQVNAINRGFALLQSGPYDFIGNLDADISIEPDYYQRLLEKFERDRSLGLAGGFVHEWQQGKFRPRRANRERSVPHAVQLFRRECYETVGGYLPFKYGGPDWHAEVVARMRAWNVQSFPDLKVLHLRQTGTAAGLLRYKFRQGKLDYSFGSYPPFEVIKCCRRFPDRPFVVGGAARLMGFVWSYVSGEKRLVTKEFMAFLRNEQKQRLLASLHMASANPQFKLS